MGEREYPPTVEDADQRKRRLEEQKVALDYIKHVSTLSTSIIVFSIAFANELAHRGWKWLLVPGIGGQLLCLVALTLTAVGVISAGRSDSPPSDKVVAFTVAGALIGLSAFLLGIASFAVFLIENLT